MANHSAAFLNFFRKGAPKRQPGHNPGHLKHPKRKRNDEVGNSGYTAIDATLFTHEPDVRPSIQSNAGFADAWLPGSGDIAATASGQPYRIFLRLRLTGRCLAISGIPDPLALRVALLPPAGSLPR